MKICDKCSVANDDKAVVCIGCGTVLPNNAQENQVNQASTEDFEQPQSYSQPQSTYAQQGPAYSQPQQPPFVQPLGSQPAYSQPPYSQPYGYVPFNENMLPEDYKPVTVWQYVGYTLLFFMPFIGFIMVLVTAFGSSKSISLRNYAKSYLVLYAIIIVIAIILNLIDILVATSLASGYYG